MQNPSNMRFKSIKTSLIDNDNDMGLKSRVIDGTLTRNANRKLFTLFCLSLLKYLLVNYGFSSPLSCFVT